MYSPLVLLCVRGIRMLFYFDFLPNELSKMLVEIREMRCWDQDAVVSTQSLHLNTLSRPVKFKPPGTLGWVAG